MYEEPFDRLCRLILASIVLIERIATLTLLEVWIHLKYSYRRCWIWVRHLFTCMRRKTALLWTHLYYGHIHTWLVVCGLTRPLTWADVEAYRLRLIAQSGQEIARPEELEEELRQEEERQRDLHSRARERASREDLRS